MISGAVRLETKKYRKSSAPRQTLASFTKEKLKMTTHQKIATIGALLILAGTVILGISDPVFGYVNKAWLIIWQIAACLMLVCAVVSLVAALTRHDKLYTAANLVILVLACVTFTISQIQRVNLEMADPHACPNKKGLIFCNILIFKI